MTSVVEWRQPEPDAPVGPGVRAFVTAFLLAVAVCGIVGLEVWPLTGWRLFSTVRHDRQVVWQAAAVGRGGTESVVDFEAFGRTYRGAGAIMAGFPDSDSAEREAACQAWARAGRVIDPGIVAIRVYRTERTARPGRSDPTPPDRRALVYQCG